MNDFEDSLNKKLNTYNTLKLVSVLFERKTNTLTLRFIYNDNLDTEQLRTQITDFTSEYFDTDCKIDVKCKKYYKDHDVLSNMIYNFMYENYASILPSLDKNDIDIIDDGILHFTIATSTNISDDVKNKLQEFLSDNLFDEFEVDYILNGTEQDTSILEEKASEFAEANIREFVPREVNFTIVDKIIGDITENKSIVIDDIHMSTTMCICGTIKFVTKRSFKKQNKAGEEIEKQYITFQLNSPYGRMRCVYFPKATDIDKLDLIVDDMTVACEGDVNITDDKRDFKVKSICTCTVEYPEKVPEDKPVFVPNTEYKYYTPEDYVDYEQSNLFTEKQPICQYVQNHNMVVFDVETTGLDPLNNEIIEIGAVKIEHGEMTKTFSVLIKPSIGYIPSEITELTGITWGMVKDCHTISQILPDFYLFCEGCDIVAYNAGFDCKFIANASAKLGFEFTNRQIDALAMARMGVVGAKNFKLKTIATKLGVSLENAHRAVHDAIATAKVVLKLNNVVDFNKL